jgi:hypothetical protein
MRKQSSQPVLAFQPQLDNSVSPPVLDTIDPQIGLVREFQITGSVWGRYEAWKTWAGDPDPVRAAWRNQFECVDVSPFRGEPNGTIWKLMSVGYVFKRSDDTVPFNQQPNQVLGQEVMDVEVRRLAINPPGTAAICTRNGGGCQILTKGRILGGSRGTGIYFLNGSGVPTVSGAGSSVTGTPATAAAMTYADTISNVFGVTATELRAMANYVVTSATDFPSPVPTNTLLVCDVPMTFTAAQPLKGTGVVVFNSNVTIAPSSYSNFNGLIYVAGNFAMREPSEVAGSLVVLGTCTIQGNADTSSISYDEGILHALRTELGSYRISGAFGRPRSQRY